MMVTQYRGPHQAACDLIFSKTDWVLASFPSGTTNFLGGDGTLSTVEATPPTFDFRLYRQVHILFQVGALTGGTSPSVTVALYWYPVSNSQSRVNNASMGNAAFSTFPGRGQFILGEGMPAFSTVGSGYGIQSMTVSPQVPLFARLTFTTTGAPTGLTNTAANPTELYIYGLR